MSAKNPSTDLMRLEPVEIADGGRPPDFFLGTSSAESNSNQIKSLLERKTRRASREGVEVVTSHRPESERAGARRVPIDPPGLRASVDSQSTDGESPVRALYSIEATPVYEAEPISITPVVLQQYQVEPAIHDNQSMATDDAVRSDYQSRATDNSARSDYKSMATEDTARSDYQSRATDDAVRPCDSGGNNLNNREDPHNNDEERTISRSQPQLQWWKRHQKILIGAVGILLVGGALAAAIYAGSGPGKTELPPPPEKKIPTPPPVGNFLPPMKACDEMEVMIVFGDYSGEISWDVRRVGASGDHVVVKAYEAQDGEAERYESMCLEEGRYNFTIRDDAGDGLCCDDHGGKGHYLVTLNRAVIKQGAEFGYAETTTFDVIDPTCDGVEVDLRIVFDDDPEEISWNIHKVEGDTLVATFDAGEHGFAMQSEHTESFCLEQGQYRFTIYDDAGDGLCCGQGHGRDGYYSLMSHGTMLAQGDNFDGPNETALFSLLDPDCNHVSVNVVFDDYSGEVSWDIKRITSSGDVVIKAYDAKDGEIEHTESMWCLGEGKYRFTVYDDAGDGLCCELGQGGYYNVTVNGAVIAQGDEFGSNETTVFNLGRMAEWWAPWTP